MGTTMRHPFCTLSTHDSGVQGGTVETRTRTDVATYSAASVRRRGEREAALAAQGKRANGSRISIVVADDHPITLAGLEALFARESDFQVLARCADGYEVVRAVAAYRPDILVIDQEMPGMDGAAIVRQLRRSSQETRAVLLATTDNHQLTEVLNLGVEGVVHKNVDPQLLIRCVREVHAGRRWVDPGLNGHGTDKVGRVPALDALTRRQVEVARAAVSGLSNKELAQRLGVSEGTIKNHLHAIYERLKVDGRLALLLYLKEKEKAS